MTGPSRAELDAYLLYADASTDTALAQVVRNLIGIVEQLTGRSRPDDCTCGHPMVVHDINKKKVRTACSVHEGPKAIACGCLTYTPQEVT